MPEERSIWLYQAKKLISLCSFILARCDHSCFKDGSIVDMTAIAMRLAVSLTDCKTWKSLKSENTGTADESVESLIEFIGTCQSGTYSCVRQYIKCLGPHVTSGKKICATATDDHFLITASAVTLALRPFHSKKAERGTDLNGASKEYFTLILTIPYLCKRMPPFLLPALKHISVLQPCLSVLLVRVLMLVWTNSALAFSIIGLIFVKALTPRIQNFQLLFFSCVNITR
jgi:ubiquitin-protein ligase E3 B